MGFFDDLKLKKDGNGNLKVTYNAKPFININVQRVHEIISDYATKKFLNKVFKLKIEAPHNQQELLDAEKMHKTYVAKKKKFYKRSNISNVGNRDFNYLIEAVKIANSFDVSFSEFIDAQIEGLAFCKGFPTPKQLTGDNAEKRLLDYISSKTNTVKTISSDYEVGSDRYRKLNKEFKDDYEMEIEEMEFLIEYHRRNHNQIPNSLTTYLEELRNSDR